MSQINFPSPPNLPLSPNQFDTRYQDGLNNVFRLYFNRISGTLQNILGPQGGQFLNFPSAAFYDTTDQTAASTTVAYPVSLNSTSFSNGVTVVSGSRITAAYSGIYNIQFSLQYVNTDSQIHDIDIWFRKNGTNLADSNSRFSVPNKHGSVDGHLIATLNFFADLVTDDYVEIMWRTDNVAISLETLPSTSSPDRPAIPSAIVTATFVSSKLEGA